MRAADGDEHAPADLVRALDGNEQAATDLIRALDGDERAPADNLERYRAKRDFARTPEPDAAGRGRGRARAHETARDRDGGAPRFVIHEHSARRLHWDLRLERDGVLESWALPKGLPLAPSENHFAARTEEHPLEYLRFNGQIPEGQYGAGSMRIWDSGTYERLKWEPRKVEVALHGRRVDARYALFAIESGERPKDWMIHRMDPPADGAREPMPEHIVPMLARAGQLPAEGNEWAYELKWDGVRAIAYSQPGQLRLESRNLNDITASYPELAALGRALSSHSAVLDGEIVAFDADARPSFAALQRRMHVSERTQARRLANTTPVTYVIFDLLWLNGHSLVALSYAERRELLGELGLNGERWQTPENVVGAGAELLAATAREGLEGIVAKRLGSTYQPGMRTREWIKVKGTGRQEFVVGGWMPGKGKRQSTIGALLLGVYDDGDLRYVGRVGSGFSDAELQRLSAALAPLERASSPFVTGERPPREAVFAEPQLVVEVGFAHWTPDGSLRAPVYEGVREDKPAREVVREDKPAQEVVREGEPAQEVMREGEPAREYEPARRVAREEVRGHEPARKDEPARMLVREGAGHGGSPAAATVTVEGRELKLSNLDKPIYPQAGTSKRQLIDYYAAVAPTLLAHLAGRALTVTRWPDGVEGKSFFQKHAPAHRPAWVRTVTLPAGGKTIDYLLADDRATVVWLANLAAIELHVPLAHAAHSERPTAVVFDLDPGAGAGMLECCQVALLLRGVLDGIGLQSFAKTSGSKGLQVYVPLNHPRAGFAQTKTFAKTLAELLEHDDGTLVVSRMTRARRTGKVLIDWSQNDANKTTVCAYSLRAGARPTVSTPVSWQEVQAARDGAHAGALCFEAEEALRRVRELGDLFAPAVSLVQELPG
jgi:bifunctional non-homologous end joining protein LigD